MCVSLGAAAPLNAEVHAKLCVAETARLRLRQLSPTDLQTLIELFTSLDVMRYSLTGPLAPGQVPPIFQTILESYQQSPLALWAVTEKTSWQTIGFCGFMPRDKGDSNEPELAYRFLPEAWGRGFATEAAAACLDLALRQPSVQRVIAHIEPANFASKRIAKKIGLEYCGTTWLDCFPVEKYVFSR
jgi:ribosomal-protein-alanine N-acetyltransferase